jgi:hypothetical protein
LVNVNVYVNVSPGVTDEPEAGDTVLATLTFPVGTVTGDGGEFTGGVVPPPGGGGGVPDPIAVSATEPAVTSAAVTT